MQVDRITLTCLDCGATYQRDPSAVGKGKYCSLRCWYRANSTPATTRFWAKVNKNGSIPDHVPHLGQCWIWTGARHKRGYGAFDRGYAHRFAFKEAFGPVLDGLFVCHHCDTPSCVRPTHLFSGTNQDNVTDLVNKGLKLRGEKVTRAKLTNEQAIEIKRLLADKTTTQNVIAQRFGVTSRLISRINVGRAWKHLTLETQG